MPASKLIILFASLFLTGCLIGCGGASDTARPAGERAKPGEADGLVPVALIMEKEYTGRGLQAALRRPTGVAYDGAGMLYLTDTQNHRILKLDTSLTLIDDAGGFGTDVGLLNRPMYVSIDFALNILVADYGNRRIARFNSHLEFVDAISMVDPEDPLRFGNPMSAAVTSFGETWVTDPERNEIVVFDHIGQFQRLIGNFGYSGGQVESPSKIILDDKRRFVVCDTENGRLVRYNIDGNYIDEPGERSLGTPVCVAQSSHGYWVVDQETSELILLNDHGDFVAALPQMLSGSTTPLSGPSDVASLGNDRLVIVDTGNNRVIICRVIFD